MIVLICLRIETSKRSMSAFPPQIAQVVRERRGGIGVNGGRDAYNSWTFFFSRKKGEGEKEEASHAHVITNAAGIHDPASPRPSTPPRLSATTSHILSSFSPVRQNCPAKYNVHVLNADQPRSEKNAKHPRLGFHCALRVSRNRNTTEAGEERSKNLDDGSPRDTSNPSSLPRSA